MGYPTLKRIEALFHIAVITLFPDIDEVPNAINPCTAVHGDYQCNDAIKISQVSLFWWNRTQIFVIKSLKQLFHSCRETRVDVRRHTIPICSHLFVRRDVCVCDVILFNNFSDLFTFHQWLKKQGRTAELDKLREEAKQLSTQAAVPLASSGDAKGKKKAGGDAVTAEKLLAEKLVACLPANDLIESVGTSKFSLYSRSICSSNLFVILDCRVTRWFH